LVASKISSTATLSFIGAIAVGSVSIFALLNALTLRKFGARTTCLAGVSLLAAGQFISSFALRNVGGLFVSAGVITGFGTSLCFMAVATLPAQYFVLRRGLANGVAYAGGGLGGACFSVVLGKLLSKLGAAWSFRALGFVTLLLGLPAAALIKERPVRRSMSFVEW
jgi:MFS family permease